MLPKSLGELHPKYNTPYKAILLIGVFSTLAPLMGRPALVWLVDSGGLGLVVSWLMVAISFIILRKKDPRMKRPFRLPGGTTLGWFAVVMAFGITILYMPGMPSALVWPYEWVIVFVWAILGVVLYKISVKKYGKEFSNKHMEEELARVVQYENGDGQDLQYKDA